MQYQYLRRYPAAIVPKLEIIVIKAERAHPLTGHGGIRTAVADVAAFVVEAFCGCASVLCNAVTDGQIHYIDLSLHLDFLRRAVMSDGIGRSDIDHWWEYELGPSRARIELDCNARIDHAAEWRAVQDRRLALAESAAGRPAIRSTPAVTVPTADVALGAKRQRNPEGLQKKRRAVLHAYRINKGYQDLKVLAKRATVGLSTDAVHAIVRGDVRHRCSEEVRVSFLRDLGVGPDEWDDIAALDRRLAQLKIDT